MQHEVFAILAFKRVDDLLVLAGAQGGDDDRLRLAAGEQGRAMRPRQQADLAIDRPHRFGVAPVDALLAAQDRAAHDLLLEVLEQFQRQGALVFILEKSGRRELCRVKPIAALLLVALAVGGFDLRSDGVAQAAFDRSLVRRRLGEIPGILGAGLGELDYCLNNRLEVLVPEGHRAEHNLFRQLLRLGLDHQHALAGAGDKQVEL